MGLKDGMAAEGAPSDPCMGDELRARVEEKGGRCVLRPRSGKAEGCKGEEGRVRER